MDTVSRVTRSQMMSGIKGRDTGPELKVRKYLHAAGLRFRLHVRALPGSPDIVFPKHRAAVFVHGCFWHRHADCRYAATPGTRTAFWDAKFKANVERDRRNITEIENAGWTPLVIWECQVKEDSALDELFWRIVCSSAAASSST